jgi:class 3 adenylate cyclase
LIGWHDRVLREAFSEHGGEEVRHTGDGFFITFERASDAVHCAVAIQRRLAAHRHEHGFAPWVRIGLHTAEAHRHGSDYSGHGVHVAARVAAIAERESILASRAVLDAAGPLDLPLSEPRSVELKGVEGPVEVRALAWD